MKRISGMILILFIISGAACKGKAGHTSAGGHGDRGAQILTSTTEIAHLHGMKVVVDLNTMAEHKRMMEMMDISMKHDPSSDHYVSVTLLDETTSDPVKNAKVSISVTPPKGAAVTKKATIMSGKGMYHYGADFQMDASGDWKVDIKINSGEKSGDIPLTFTM